MAYRTLETILHPDSHLALPSSELPQRPVRVMVTIMEEDETDLFVDTGDYAQTLEDYEDLLAQGAIQW